MVRNLLLRRNKEREVVNANQFDFLQSHLLRAHQRICYTHKQKIQTKLQRKDCTYKLKIDWCNWYLQASLTNCTNCIRMVITTTIAFHCFCILNNDAMQARIGWFAQHITYQWPHGWIKWQQYQCYSKA